MRDPALDLATRTAAGRDPAALARGLEQWLMQRWPQARLLDVAPKAGSGASSELFFLRLAGRPGADAGTETLVLRLRSAWPVYPVEDLALQAACMTAIGEQLGRAPAVPAVYACVADAPPAVGAPFLLMQRLDGRPAPDVPSYVLGGWLSEATDAERETLWRRGVEAIAAVHATPVTAAARARCRLPGGGAAPLRRLLDYWDRFLAHVEHGGRYPALRAATAWLRANCPAGYEHDGYVWGDASLRNMLFDGFAPCALLDFEFAHVGLSEFDVGFYALMDHVMAQGFAGGAPRLGGFGGMHDTFDHYEHCTGRRIPDREFMLRCALTYMALSTTRVFQRLAAQGHIAAADVAGNPPLRYLAAVMAGTAALPD